MTMPRRRVHTAGSRFAVGWLLLCFTDVELSFRVCFSAKRDVLANHQQRRAIEPCVPGFESIQFCARKACQHFRRGLVP